MHSSEQDLNVSLAYYQEKEHAQHEAIMQLGLLHGTSLK